MGEGDEGKEEGYFPALGRVFEGHDFGVVGGDAGHEEGEAVSGGVGAGEKVGGNRCGAFTTDF